MYNKQNMQLQCEGTGHRKKRSDQGLEYINPILLQAATENSQPQIENVSFIHLILVGLILFSKSI